MKGTQVAERTRRAAASTRRRGTDEDAGGGGLNRDYSGEEYREPGEGYQGPTPAKGLYPAKLVQVKDHVSGEGNESVRWSFELTGGESVNEDGDKASVAGFRDHQYTNDSTTLWREQQIAVALGLVKPNGKLKMSYAMILKKAKPCTVRIIRERYVPEDGGDPEWRAKIAAVLSARETTAAKPSSRRRKDEDVEDVFDDEAEEVDEDEEAEEEEAPPPRRSRSRRKAEPEPEEEEEEEPEDEGEEDEEPYDPDALAAELEDLSLAALKKRARDEFGVTIKRGMDADTIIEAVLDTLDADEEEPEEEEEEEPPPPPKRASRTRAAAKPARRKARGGSDDPPF